MQLGLNVVVLTETARVGEASGGTKRVYGYHFVRAGSGWRQIWRIADAVEDCPAGRTQRRWPLFKLRIASAD